MFDPKLVGAPVGGASLDATVVPKVFDVFESDRDPRLECG